MSSRRDFLKSTGKVAVVTTLPFPEELLNKDLKRRNAPEPLKNSSQDELMLLNKITYGPRVEDIEYFKRVGFKNFVEEQLNPKDNEDQLFLEKLASCTLKINYRKKSDESKKMIEEIRHLECLNQALPELWEIYRKRRELSEAEIRRPILEVMSAMWLRATYSKWQLREILVDFWYNHFNVDAFSHDAISVTWPIFDRDVIRKNCLGNFRQFLEDVAKSQAMQYYLDNYSSKASPANENYARELFELHTLGSENYYNNLYNKWRDVPGALNGKPIGYIDQDVYEAARAFTGWTIADGSRTALKGGNLPDTGEFIYHDGWHDNYQKRVLGVEFDPNQSPLADGKKVLDLVAFHPATARHICMKLCRRFISDNPPESVIEKATKVWIKHKDTPDQIRETMRVIILSEEFSKSCGEKIKRPFELTISFLRLINAEIFPNTIIFEGLRDMGYKMFSWPTPDGHPDRSDYWISTQMMTMRWKMFNYFLNNYQGVAQTNLDKLAEGNNNSCEDLVRFWSFQLLNKKLPVEKEKALIDFHLKIPDFSKRNKSIITFICMSPEFQVK